MGRTSLIGGLRRQIARGMAATAIAAICLMAQLSSSRADDTAAFYQKHPITLYVFSEAGSTYDIYARLLARHLGDHLPGKPSVVVENMLGAGGLKLMDYLYRIAPKDGSVIGAVGRGLPFEPLLGHTDIAFDPIKYVWLGSMNRDLTVAISWHTSKVKTLDDLTKTELLVPGTGAGADSQIIPLAMNALVGTKFKIIDGYPSTTTAALAMERGELDGIAYWSWSSLETSQPNWVHDKTVNVLFHTAVTPPPELADFPAIRKVVKNEIDSEALNLLLAREIMGRPFVAPPGLPADRAAALRSAFEATMQDPSFLAEAKTARADVELVTGQEVDDILKAAYSSPKPVIDRLKEVLGRK